VFTLKLIAVLKKNECSCPSFPVIQYCKHIHAIYIHFGSQEESAPTIPLSFASSTFANLPDIDPALQPSSPTLPSKGAGAWSTILVKLGKDFVVLMSTKEGPDVL
jgi:hypothetical protein